MRKPEIYLDNSATTRPCDAAVEAVLQSMREGYYNPSALYAPAVSVERTLRAAREEIAASVQANERNVIFTSGGTESDNLAIAGYLRTLREPGEVLYSAAEHPAVKNACRDASTMFGHAAREIPLDKRGIVDITALEGMLGPSTRLICVMQVCNETGAVMPLKRVAEARDRFAPGAAIHVDGVQGYLRLPFSIRDLHVQSYAVSAHKVHGPKGVGALIVGEGHRILPMMAGGGQQQNLRSGTENAAGIAGFAAAIHDFPADASVKLAALKKLAADMLAAGIPDFRVLGPLVDEADAAPHILYAALPPVRAETLVHALESEGVLVGTGSACASHKRKHSDSLTAMGISPALMDSSIRLSFSVNNTVEEVREAMECILRQYAVLSRFTRR